MEVIPLEGAHVVGILDGMDPKTGSEDSARGGRILLGGVRFENRIQL